MSQSFYPKALRRGSLLCGALASIAEILAVLIHYDGNSNYFESPSIFHTIAVTLALLGVALGIVAACLHDKATAYEEIFIDRFRVSPATVGYLISSIFTWIYCSETSAPTVGIIAAVLLLCGAAYSIVSGMPTLREHKKSGVILLGMLTVIGTILLNAYYYFDVSVEMNAPFKLTTQMGLLCVTIYLTGELRFLLGRQMPRFFLVLCTTLVSIGSLSSLSLLIAFFCDKLDRADYTAGALLVFCSMLSAMLRMRRLLTPIDHTISDEIKEVEE